MRDVLCVSEARNLRSDAMARRPNDTRENAEAAFKKATTKAPEPMPKTQSLPGINAALRKTAGL